jgi:hypothetical protein
MITGDRAMVYMTRGFKYDGGSTVAANIRSRIVRYAGTEQALCSRLVRYSCNNIIFKSYFNQYV